MFSGGWQSVQGLLDLVTHPTQVLDGIRNLVDMLLDGNLFDVLAEEIGALAEQLRNWPSLSMYDKGYTAGQLIGRYGVDLILASGAARLFNRL